MNKNIAISLIHPTMRVKASKGFPRAWRAVFDAWLERADHPEVIEYVISVHDSRWLDFMTEPWIDDGVHIHNAGWGRAIEVRNPGADTNVSQLNWAAEHATGRVLMGVMDDYYPPEHWDTMILSAIDPAYEEIVVCATGAGDERDRELMIGGAMTRKRYARYGYVLHPDFESMYADNYYVYCARRDEHEGLVTIKERFDIVFDHRHPIFGKGEADAAYEQQNRAHAYRQGLATLRRLVDGTRVIAACLPGEEFSHWVTSALVELMCHMERGNRFMVERYWAHSSNVYTTRLELTDRAISFGARPDFVYWQDDDNPVTAQQFELLLADLEGHPELSGVVGWCWTDDGDYEDGNMQISCGRQGPNLECKRFTLQDLTNAIDNKRLAITSDDIAPDAFWSGFPVVLLRGEAVERLGWESFLPMLGKNFHRGFTSEDTTFFYRAHQLGMKFGVDLRVKVPHLKRRAIEPRWLPDGAWEKVLDGQWMKPVKPVEETPSEEPLYEESQVGSCAAD